MREIYFRDSGYRLKPKSGNSPGYWLEDGGDVTVIGNIHENPELLEVK